MAEEKDFYKTLGVSKNATDQEIKQAYRQQALKWHPDKHQGEEKKKAETEFKKINQAYEVLRDPQKRKTYDQFGSAAFEQGGSGGFRGGNPFGGAQGGYQQGPFTYTYRTSGNANFEDLFGGFSDPFDIFEQFFGGGFSRQQTQRKPVYQVQLNFMEAIKGIEKDVSVSGSKKKIKIPAGVDNNMRIRFSDFDLLISVRPHDTFKRQGQDIIIDMPISFTQAALGDVIHVPTIDGEFKIKVRAGTQPGTIIRLRGKGVPVVRGSARGDQYIRLKIEVPKHLSRKQKNILREFEESQ